MVEQAIGLGLAISLVFSETLGLAAGGMVVPGYLALMIHEPMRIAGTVATAPPTTSYRWPYETSSPAGNLRTAETSDRHDNAGRRPARSARSPPGLSPYSAIPIRTRSKWASGYSIAAALFAAWAIRGWTPWRRRRWP